jgi:hypothetical protein
VHNLPQQQQQQQQQIQFANELSGNRHATTSVQAASKLTPNLQRVLLETSFGSPPTLREERKMNRKQNGHAAKKPSKSVAFSNNGVSYPPAKYKPTTLSLCETRPNPFQGNIVDLIYDDWFGLAPLASPESLSELSSISSRASISLNLNLSNSIEKFLNKVTSCKHPSPPLVIPANPTVIDIEESQLHTPKIIRRTPKFSENLSSCAMDWKTQNSYKRMGKIFLNNPPFAAGSDSDDGSYGTAESLPKRCANREVSEFLVKDENKDWKSADNIGSDLSLNHNAEISHSAMISDCRSQCPVCPCTKLPPEKCCRRVDHIGCIMMSAQEYHASGKYSIANTTSSSDTYYSLTGSECSGLLQNGTKVLMSKLGTYEEETLTCELPSSQNINPSTISSITRSGILESHFPVYFDSSDEKSSLLSHENSPRQRKTSGGSSNNVIMRKKSNDEEFSVFSRNESLPLLNLVEKSSPTNYVKRKRIHPIHTPPIIHQISPKIVPMTKHSRSTPASISNLYVFNESHV